MGQAKAKSTSDTASAPLRKRSMRPNLRLSIVPTHSGDLFFETVPAEIFIRSNGGRQEQVIAMCCDLICRMTQVEAERHKGVVVFEEAVFEKPAGEFWILIPPSLKIFGKSVYGDNVLLEETHVA